MKLYKLYQRYRDEDAVIVYQMGKVGSTSLEVSIPNSLHVHSLYSQKICPVPVLLKKCRFCEKIKLKITNFIKRVAIRKRSKIKIITLIRDPYERDLSHYFQDLYYWITLYVFQYKIDDRFDGALLVENAFIESYNFDYGKEWFEKELFNLCGINFNDIDTLDDFGHYRLEKENFDILFIDSVKINESSKIISEFIGKEIIIKNQNNSGDKWYSDMYKDFKETYSPPENLIDKLYSYQWVKSFYREEKIKKMIKLKVSPK